MNSMQPTIRPIMEEDKTAWHRLWSAYLEFYQSSVSDEVYDATFARILDDRCPDQNGLMAFADGQAAGLVHFIYHPHNWRVEKVCYLQDLYTDPEHRGKGIGRALIEAVYRASDKNNTPAVYWLTQEFNTTARLLYDRIATVTPFIKYQR